MDKKTKTVNAIDLKLNRFVRVGGNDYRITGITLNGMEKVIVTVIPVGLKNLCAKHQLEVEIVMIVPQKAPFTVLK